MTPPSPTSLQLPSSLAGRQVVVIDVEGNGRRPPEIIEIAVLPMTTTHAATVADLRTWLVRPVTPITGIVTSKVHGITNADVADAPLWTEVADDIVASISGRVMVAHHAAVENRVLGAHLPGWEPPLVLDTLRLAKTVWPDLPGGYGLDHLIAHTHLPPPPTTAPIGKIRSDAGSGGSSRAGRRHRAGYDTWMTAALLITLLTELDEHGDEHGDELGGSAWTHLTAAAALPLPRPARSPDASAGTAEQKEGGLW